MSNNPLDVWFKFDSDADEDPSHEANTYMTDMGFVVEWSNTSVGQVTRVEFATLVDAHNWLEDSGYVDYTS